MQVVVVLARGGLSMVIKNRFIAQWLVDGDDVRMSGKWTKKYDIS